MMNSFQDLFDRQKRYCDDASITWMTLLRIWLDVLGLASIMVGCLGAGLDANNPAVIQPIWDAGRRRQAILLRDVFGNPFRPVTIDPSWLAWNNSTIPNLAQGIYEERAFDRLPILADALEEAGCNDADILAHCRSGGDHVRGCWAVDLVRSVD
jgi:hypothetical protein